MASKYSLGGGGPRRGRARLVNIGSTTRTCMANIVSGARGSMHSDGYLCKDTSKCMVSVN